MRVNLPNAGKKAERGVPWLVEDRLINPVEDNALYWAKSQQHPQQVDVLVCDQAVLSEFRNTLSELGLGAARLMPVHALIPLPDAGENRLSCFAAALVADERGSGVLAAAITIDDEVDADWVVDRLVDASVPALVSETASGISLPNPWLSGLAALVWLGLALALTWSGMVYTAEANEQRDQAYRLLDEALPGINRRLDIERQARQRLKGGGDTILKRVDTRVLPRISAIARTLTEADVSVLRYRVHDTSYIVTAQLPNLAAVAGLQTRLQAAGLAADVTTARQETDRALVDVVVQL